MSPGVTFKFNLKLKCVPQKSTKKESGNVKLSWAGKGREALEYITHTDKKNASKVKKRV